jgi:hypothetical protein
MYTENSFWGGKEIAWLELEIGTIRGNCSTKARNSTSSDAMIAAILNLLRRTDNMWV